MQDYIALADGPDGQPFVVIAGGNDLSPVRLAAEEYVLANPDTTVTVFNRASAVTSVRVAKWQ